MGFSGLVSPSRHAMGELKQNPPVSKAPMDTVVGTCWIGLIVCAVGLGWSTSIASRSAPGEKLHFHIFWASILAFLVPTTIALLRKQTRDVDRVLLVIALGMLSLAPKYLSYPGGPAFFDEYAHWTQTERLFESGLLFQKNNQVVVIGDYPAMHAAAAALRHITGLSTYHVSLLMLVAQHVVSLAAVFAIGTRVGKSRHAGGIAALLYAVGPGFWFFNAQFSYEAYAIHIFLWSCVALVYLQSAKSSASVRTSWLVVGMWLSFALVSSHHLSSYLNLIVATTFVIASIIRWLIKRETHTNVLEIGTFFVSVLFLTVWWFLKQAPNTYDYYAPLIQNGITETLSIFDTFGGENGEISGDVGLGTTEEPAARTFFEGSTLPTYEQVISFIVPPLSLLLAAVAFIVQWRRGLAKTAAIAMTGICGLYFLVFPLMLSETGAEGARRSWSFTSLGFSVLVAVGLYSIAYLNHARFRIALMAASTVAISLLMIGNVAVGMNEVYRFPGTYVYGSDTRSATDDIFAAADWFIDTQGPDQPMIGDRTTQVAFASRAQTVLGIPNDANPIWDYTIGEKPPDNRLLTATIQNQLQYVVIDKRQVTAIPLVGFYLDQNEPLALERNHPVGPESLRKFDQLDYAMRIYSSENIVVYRLDLSRIRDLAADVIGT